MNSATTSPDTIPEILPGIELSEEQWDAIQAIEDFLQSPSKLYLLTGYAGTRKTTLLQALVTHLREHGCDWPIALPAQVSKADASSKPPWQRPQALGTPRGTVTLLVPGSGTCVRSMASHHIG